MCGLSGWVGLEKPDIESLQHVSIMTDALTHRGPDCGSVMDFKGAILGHRRLSVIDLSENANQPLISANGRYVTVYNGEVYNFKEIRNDLEAIGIQFRSNSDTEVVLEAYGRWGPACLNKFNGMFAIAIWDIRQQTLFLARDRMGEKPLFYASLKDGSLIFASELKALMTHPGLNRDINPAAISHFLSCNYTLGSVPILSSVSQLPPGSYGYWRKNTNITVKKYWDVEECFRNKRQFKSYAEAAEELRSLIDDAVRLRLVSDVPIGAFLSGGVDSSTIVASMRQAITSSNLATFSLGFQEKTYSELPEARRLASVFNTQHFDRMVTVDMAKQIEQMSAHTDQPFADTSFIPVYFLSKLAREHVTVCLSGDGGDECFAGYETYMADRLHSFGHWMPSSSIKMFSMIVNKVLPVTHNKVGIDYKVKKFISGLNLSSDQAHWFWRNIFENSEKENLIRDDVIDSLNIEKQFDVCSYFLQNSGDFHPLERAQILDFKTWLVDDILVKVDRASMAHGLEVRTPFLDHRIVEFSAALPPDWKLSKLGTKKAILKSSQKGRVPNDVLSRSKKGFNAPVSHWISGGLKELGRDLTMGEAIGRFINRPAVDKLWRDHIDGKADNGLKLFGLMMLALWLESFARMKVNTR